MLRRSPVQKQKNNIGDVNPLLLSFHFEPRPDNPNSLLNLFSQLNLRPSNNNDMASSSVPATSSREIKLNMASPFSGKREDLIKFWQDCCVFTAINNKIYNTNKRKIAFVLSLLTEGEAASCGRNSLLGKLSSTAKNRVCPQTSAPLQCLDFFEAFRPFDQTGDAWAEMKEMRFNGPTGNMDKHIACFKLLLTKTGMTDSTAIIDCF